MHRLPTHRPKNTQRKKEREGDEYERSWRSRSYCGGLASRRQRWIVTFRWDQLLFVCLEKERIKSFCSRASIYVHFTFIIQCDVLTNILKHMNFIIFFTIVWPYFKMNRSNPKMYTFSFNSFKCLQHCSWPLCYCFTVDEFRESDWIIGMMSVLYVCVHLAFSWNVVSSFQNHP